MRMYGDFAFKHGTNFVGDGRMIEIRGGPQIDKKIATVGYLITRESASDPALPLRGSHLSLHAPEIPLRPGAKYRVLPCVWRSRPDGHGPHVMLCLARCNVESGGPVGPCKPETGRFTDKSGINMTKFWFYCANAFAAALLVRDKCKSDRALKVSVLDLSSCHDHRSNGAFGVIRAEAC